MTILFMGDGRCMEPGTRVNSSFTANFELLYLKLCLQRGAVSQRHMCGA